MEPLENPITLRNTIHSLRASLTAATDRIAALESAPPPDNVERWVKYTTMFNAPELLADNAGSPTPGNPTVEIANIPANSVATGVRFEVPTLFSGGTLTNVEALIYSLGSTGGYIAGTPAISTTLFAPPTLSNLGLVPMILAGTSATPITLPFFMTGGYGNALVAGQLDTYIRLSIPQSTGTTLPTA